MSRKGLPIGLGQLKVTMGDKNANEAELVHGIEEAARSAAEGIPGDLTRRLREMAKRHKMAIVVGSPYHLDWY